MKGIGYRETKAGSVQIFKKHAYGLKAELAIRFLDRWGMVMVDPDGEDSAGRVKVKKAPVVDIVKRACDMAEATYSEFEKRDWILELPDPKD